MCFKFGTEMEDGPRLHRQRAVFASLWAIFFIALVYAGHAVFVIRLRGFKDWSLSCAKPCVNCLLEHRLFNTCCWCTCNSADLCFSALRDCVCLLCHMQASERDLRLTYFPQFKACVDAGTYNLMCSYYRCFTSILAFSALLCLALFWYGSCLLSMINMPSFVK